MMPEYFQDILATGTEVAIIAEPRRVIVDCRGRAIRDHHLVAMTLEPDLTDLWLSGCDVSNIGVSKLVANQRLKWLDLSETRVDGDIQRIVPLLPNLEGIGLSRIPNVNANTKYLINHPKLNSVDLSHTDVTFQSLARLLKNSRVDTADVKGTTITACEIATLDDDDAHPYRYVHVYYGESDSVSILMPIWEARGNNDV